MAELLKGAPVADALNSKLKEKVTELADQGICPCLAILRVGERPDDIAYERGAIKHCEKIGVQVKQVIMEEDISQERLITAIQNLNEDTAVHGVLMFRPLPGHIDEALICNMLAPEKDVDGITSSSNAGVFTGADLGYPPCTPQACMEMLDYYRIDPYGKKAVVIGRSLVVGKPAAMMLIHKNATVTICHTKTLDMPAVCRNADILVVAAGKAKIIDAGYLSPGQIVLDVGIHVDENDHLCGDVDFNQAEPIVAAITPVPGGVGTVTTSVLIGHVLEAAGRHL